MIPENSKRFVTITKEDGTKECVDTQMDPHVLKAQIEHEQGREKQTFTPIERAIRREKEELKRRGRIFP